MEEFLQLMAEFGISETAVMYGFVALILLIIVLSILATGTSIKDIYKIVGKEIVNEAKAAGVTVESMFDQIFDRVKSTLRKPDPTTGKIPAINRLLIIVISFPLVKMICIKAVKKHINYILDNEKLEPPKV